MRHVFFAGEESHEWPADFGVVIANGSFEHGEFLFDRIEDGSLGDGAGDLDGDFAGEVREGAKVGGEDDVDCWHSFQVLLLLLLILLL